MRRNTHMGVLLSKTCVRYTLKTDTLCVKNWVILNTDWYLIYVMYTFMLASPVRFHRQTHMNANEAREEERAREAEWATQKSEYLIAKRPD